MSSLSTVLGSGGDSEGRTEGRAEGRGAVEIRALGAMLASSMSRDALSESRWSTSS